MATDANLHQFIKILVSATSRVSPAYFQLPVNRADAVYRERVYGYELYHQLRSLWSGCSFSLGGEVDKIRHPHFRGGPYARAKPDFLVHVPGEMDKNLAVVEVKPVTASWHSLRKDLCKLGWFCRCADYFTGVLIVYGTTGNTNELQRKLRKAADGVDPPRVIMFHHRQAGQCAEQVNV